MREIAKSTSSTAETRSSASMAINSLAERYSSPPALLPSVAARLGQRKTPAAAAAPTPARKARLSSFPAITARDSVRGSAADVGATFGNAGLLEADSRESGDAFAA